MKRIDSFTLLTLPVNVAFAVERRKEDTVGNAPPVNASFIALNFPFKSPGPFEESPTTPRK